MNMNMKTSAVSNMFGLVVTLLGKRVSVKHASGPVRIYRR